ncbi:hypothetical protein BAUCODRAFT_537989 [Baudoinia panamericana UAMH 10762]|uniref:Uncharacterized protein n=1 Tax=Baudoinia panamericana (strain UAMH 10762) TaxID=717646 RepID=M2MFD4_BAUPA|nr:uncharacterized protein BAUCODRAFT_537989 [Baudoinia panamericana UAMH 10762]EMC95356.1 hypothetical protein BAUCODRAFT_537989 [Baudoinia panamericana UAMH 10762]
MHGTSAANATTCSRSKTASMKRTLPIAAQPLVLPKTEGQECVEHEIQCKTWTHSMEGWNTRQPRNVLRSRLLRILRVTLMPLHHVQIVSACHLRPLQRLAGIVFGKTAGSTGESVHLADRKVEG